MSNIPKVVFFLLAIFCITTISSCKKKEILSEDKMLAVLKDLYLTESMYDVNNGNFRSDKSKTSLYSAVLEKYGITEAQLDSSLVWYSDNAQIYIRINDSIISSLRQDLKDIETQYAQENNIKSRPLEPVPSFFYLSGEEPLLRIDIDSVVVKRFPNFNLNLQILGSKPTDSLIVSLAYVYKDTTILDEQFLSENKSYNLKNTSILPIQDLKSIYGYLYVNPAKIGCRNILLHNMSIK